ncbi:MAG TPA: 50S ribosomal protein L10 [Dehalococcoidales bacterium]|nr:50S ribosomal protein L10 [Dehalococcoidales bacterium]
MPTEKKKQVIGSLEQAFSRCDSGILTDYRGLKTSELVALRRKIRESGAEFHVVKNTLARIAAKNAGKEAIGQAFDGQLAIVFAYEDITRTSKTLTEYLATSKVTVSIKGGFLGNKVLNPQEVKALAALPSRKVLIGKVMGGIQGPLYGLMYMVNAPVRGLMVALQERMKQLEGVK